MSYYYNYYIGYEKDGKLYPLGPYDQSGRLHDALSKSRSFASDLHDKFYRVSDDMISEELRKDFSYETYDHKTEMRQLKYLPVDNLPTDKLESEGYCLIEGIKRYEEEGDIDDLLYDMLTPQEYIRKMENELKFGRPERKFDEEGGEFEIHSCDEYSYYRFIDYNSPSYESFILQLFVNVYEYTSAVPDGATIVILETEG